MNSAGCIKGAILYFYSLINLIPREVRILSDYLMLILDEILEISPVQKRGKTNNQDKQLMFIVLFACVIYNLKK